MGILLFIIAIILATILYPIGYIYGLLKAFFQYSSKVLLLLAIGIDRLGNVICKDLFNDTLRKKGGHDFGGMNETVSRGLGLNKKAGTLTWLGRLFADLLNWIHKNHVEDASK